MRSFRAAAGSLTLLCVERIADDLTTGRAILLLRGDTGTFAETAIEYNVNTRTAIKPGICRTRPPATKMALHFLVDDEGRCCCSTLPFEYGFRRRAPRRKRGPRTIFSSCVSRRKVSLHHGGKQRWEAPRDASSRARREHLLNEESTRGEAQYEVR